MKGAFCSNCGHLLRFMDGQTYHFNLDSCNWITSSHSGKKCMCGCEDPEPRQIIMNY